MKVRSMVGLIPLFAVEMLEPEIVDAFPASSGACNGSSTTVPTCPSHEIDSMNVGGHRNRRLLSMVSRRQLRRMLRFMLDEKEFLSPHGIRSAFASSTRENPYVLTIDGRSIASATTLPNPPPDCSAAIPTGADPCGFPSIFCSSNRCRGSIIITATNSRWNAPPAPAR